MTIVPNTIEAIEYGAYCWVMIRCEHEPAFKALLNTVAASSRFLYTPVSEIRIHGLSDVQQAEMIQGREELIYPDKHGAVLVLEELWSEVEEAVTRIASTATIRHQIAAALSFVDPNMIDKLRTELSRHPSLIYVVIEFGED